MKRKNITQTHPEIASEWHPTRNNGILAEHLTYGSGFDAWWICPKGHEWKGKVVDRTRKYKKCPYCKRGKDDYEVENEMYMSKRERLRMVSLAKDMCQLKSSDEKFIMDEKRTRREVERKMKEIRDRIK